MCCLLLTLLPLQWSWSAAASVCLHEQDPAMAAHVGHHQATSAVAAVVPATDLPNVEQRGDVAAGDVLSTDRASMSIDPGSPTDSCGTCHLHGLQGLPETTPSLPVIPAHAASTPHRNHFPEGLAEGLFRPPLGMVS